MLHEKIVMAKAKKLRNQAWHPVLTQLVNQAGDLIVTKNLPMQRSLYWLDDKYNFSGIVQTAIGYLARHTDVDWKRYIHLYEKLLPFIERKGISLDETTLADIQDIGKAMEKAGDWKGLYLRRRGDNAYGWNYNASIIITVALYFYVDQHK